MDELLTHQISVQVADQLIMPVSFGNVRRRRRPINAMPCIDDLYLSLSISPMSSFQTSLPLSDAIQSRIIVAISRSWRLTSWMPI